MLKKFTVKRSQWLRGEDHYFSYLFRNSDKKMCCLGFMAIECGKSFDTLAQKNSLAYLSNKDNIPDFMFNPLKREDSLFADSLMRINDDPRISDSVRENLLREKFLTQNIQIIFED